MTSPSIPSAPPTARDLKSLTAYFVEHGYPPPHPLVLLFPRMTAAEQKALTVSIRDDGVHDPITKFGNQIADGRSRCLAAIELRHSLGEQLPQAEFDGDELSLLPFLIAKNLLPAPQ